MSEQTISFMCSIMIYLLIKEFYMEKLTIENFAGIEHMEFEFKSINLLIGESGTGKSVAIKLLFFFKRFLNDLASRRNIFNSEGKKYIVREQTDRFKIFFPEISWPTTDFKITYAIGNIEVYIEKTGRLKFDYSKELNQFIRSLKVKLNKLEKELKEINNPKNFFEYLERSEETINAEWLNKFPEIELREQIFMPSGRGFFAQLDKHKYLLSRDNNHSFDPFLVEFGIFCERLNISSVNTEYFQKILSATYEKERLGRIEREFLVHLDGRKVPLLNASSGQQEVLPLLLLLTWFLQMPRRPNINRKFTVYIEEPEAHLYPSIQNEVVQFLASTFNNENLDLQLVLTTHSPYLLSSFNNLLYAGKVTDLHPDKAEEIAKIIPKNQQITPNSFCAYSLSKGKSKFLIEDSLIADGVDDISNKIMAEFSNLLDFE
jgi:AAA15 family ATPase/GTPase